MTKDAKRKGDIAEHYAINWLWEQGFEVFKNSGCSANSYKPISYFKIRIAHFESGAVQELDQSGKHLGRNTQKHNETV